jgi:hypothetical protein
MGFYRGPNNVRNGLVVQLDPINPKSYPGTGSIIYDISIEGGVRNATMVNNPTFTGNSISLTESSFQYFTISQPSVGFNPNNWSIELVLKPQATGYVVSPQSAGFDHFLFYSATSQNIGFQTTQSTDVNNRGMNSPNNSVPLNRWTHIIATLNNFQKRLYINGRLSVQDDVSVNTSFVANWSSNWWFGDRAQIGGNAWSGEYGLIRIYNREFTADEVNQNFYSIKGRYENLIDMD